MSSDLHPITQLLDRYAASSSSSERQAVEEELFERFGTIAAIMVTDMASFSQSVANYGIVHYLSLIHQCHRLLLPLIKHHEGQTLRCEADNTYALFEHSQDAIKAAAAAQYAITQRNKNWSEKDHIGISIGIGYGRLLLCGRSDAFGHEFNLASKLGEDVAESGDILLTTATCEDAGLSLNQVQACGEKISGLNLEYFKLISL